MTKEAPGDVLSERGKMLCFSVQLRRFLETESAMPTLQIGFAQARGKTVGVVENKI